MARLLADEDFDFTIVEALRTRGHEVVRHQDLPEATRGEPDGDVLARALAESRLLLTHNRRDFLRIHRSGAPHAGILTVPQHPNAEGAASQIDGLLAVEPSLAGRLFRINRPPVGPLEDPPRAG